MQRVDTLIVGAGVTGLAAAGRLEAQDYLVIEAEATIGGYCRTILRDGFVWDYSGHFFHFRRPPIEQWLRARMPGERIATVRKRALVAYKEHRLDYPFQKNIHQLPLPEFLECLHDLYFAERDRPMVAPATLRSTLQARYGRAICEKFLVPYNEKVYACDLDSLDADAMGRFFPAPSLADILRHFRQPSDDSYNALFCYPQGGAMAYVRALATAVRPEAIRTDEALLAVDLDRKIARTTRHELVFDRMISTVPLPHLAKLAGLEHEPHAFDWSKVQVLNLGFDRKGPTDVHWIYFPETQISFYRVGFYDNILAGDRMSLYVEIALPRAAEVDLELLRARSLDDLRRVGIVSNQRLVAEHHVLLDPAYVHVTARGQSERDRLLAKLRRHGVYSIGRYGEWKYCSIEDNIAEAWGLVEDFERRRGTA